MSCCRNTPSRRTFLTAGGAATAAFTLAACSTGPEQETFSGGVFTEAVELDSLAVGASIQLVVGADQVLLHRETTDTIHAYSAVCTHQGCVVGANAEDPSGPFICPCHASNYDKLTGEAVAGPAQRPLTRHQTAIENGWVLVEVTEA